MSTLITAAQSREQVIEGISAIRNDAIAMEDTAKAVDFAIQATLTIVDTGIEVVEGAGHGVTKGLAEELANKWSFAPAEEEAAAE